MAIGGGKAGPCNHIPTRLGFLRHPPPDVFGQSFLAGVQLVTEGAPVLLLLESCVGGVLLLVHREVGLGGVTLETDVTLEWLLPRVHSGVTFILPCKK